MPDEPDPPRQAYGFKPREFERANPARPAAPSPDAPAPDPGITVASDEKINVHDLIRASAGAGRQLGSNAIVNRTNEVHDVLRANFERDVAAGHYDLGVLDDSKRRRRIRNYWIAIVAFDTPLAVIAFSMGHEVAIPFTCAIAAIALFTSYLTWNTFFLRTHY